MSAAPTRVLFVCLGNICRSPAAEGVFLQQLALAGLEGSFVVDSAGTGSWHVGQPADPRMRAAAERRGVHLPSRARQLSVSDLQTFDHILTMDAENLAAVQALSRRSRPRATITPLLQFCRRFPHEEVPDPYYGGETGFDHVLDLLEDACEGLLAALQAERHQPDGAAPGAAS
ncbi:MAG: low molecular weight phosphotyrosine protein phosphatase [Cyanobacteria bacterium]|jgi:protein-tyrosine phosphatase|nr:low molecular weight phosphotyrosine protein phosphatase [Cyanobacteriota bacterium]